MTEKFLVDLWVEEYSEAGSTEAFCPDAVARDTRLSVRDVFERLLFLVSDGRLVLQWEVHCPNCGKVMRERGLDRLHCEETRCPGCRNTINVSADIIYPLFSVSPEYKDHVIKRPRRLVFSSAFKRAAVAKR